MNIDRPAVLILDDDCAVRESLVCFFEDAQWRVSSAGSAEEALEQLAHDRPTVALVDLRLPGMDGNAFIRRALPMRPSMICMICTGSPEYRMPEDLVDHPRVFQEIVTKPIKDLAALEAMLKQLIQRYNEGSDESE